MKKAILSITVLLCIVGYSKSAAQVSVAVKIGTPVHCSSPASVTVVPASQVLVVQPPVHVVARPVRRVAIYG